MFSQVFSPGHVSKYSTCSIEQLTCKLVKGLIIYSAADARHRLRTSESFNWGKLQDYNRDEGETHEMSNEAQTSDVHRAVVPLSTMHYDPARNVLCTRDHCFAERPLAVLAHPLTHLRLFHFLARTVSHTVTDNTILTTVCTEKILN